jgi:hypothetical protein
LAATPRQLFRNLGGDQTSDAFLHLRTAIFWNQLGDYPRHRARAVREVARVGGHVERLRPIAKQPTRRPLHQLSPFEQHIGLDLRRGDVVQCFDFRPHRRHVENLPGDHVSTRDVCRVGSSLFAQSKDERHPCPVDYFVGELGADDVGSKTV